MQIGVIGYGKQAQKIINVLRKKKVVKKINIYKKNKFKKFSTDKKLVLTNNLNKLNDLDCVFICSPNLTHIAYVKYFINKTKYIFCEKPGPTNIFEINYLKSLNITKKKKIYFNYNYNFSKYFKNIEKEINNEKNGKIINFSFYASHGLFYNKKIKKNIIDRSVFSNILGNLGIHYLNFLCKIFKKISIIKLHNLNMSNKGNDTSFSYIKSDNIFGNLFLSYASVLYKFAIIHFTNSIIIFDNHELKKFSPRDTFTKNGLFKTPKKKILQKNNNKDIIKSLELSLNFFLNKVKKDKGLSIKDYNLAIKSSKILIDIKKNK